MLLLNTVFDVPVAQVVQVPLYLAATCTLFGVRLWSTGLLIFWEIRNVPCSVLLGSTVDTRLASVYEAFGRISRSCVGLWEMTS